MSLNPSFGQVRGGWKPQVDERQFRRPPAFPGGRRRRRRGRSAQVSSKSGPSTKARLSVISGSSSTSRRRGFIRAPGLSCAAGLQDAPAPGALAKLLEWPSLPTAPFLRVSAENLVEIDDVNFGYGRRPVLDGISMRMPRGKVVAIMGGSGCGKTTLLRLIGGQLRPHERQRSRRRPGWSTSSTPTASTRCAGAWACCSSSARCSPT